MVPRAAGYLAIVLLGLISMPAQAWFVFTGPRRPPVSRVPASACPTSWPAGVCPTIPPQEVVVPMPSGKVLPAANPVGIPKPLPIQPSVQP